ncbi:TrgA family protein [Aquicoccus sp. SCR17]|nr:TrgA family protein [Carideicomes alvinocaridis]
MPTAAKLAAAIALAVVAWIVSEQVKLLFPEGKYFGNFNYINAAIGFLCGWVVIGRQAGRGYSAGISYGITGTAAMVFWALVVHSGGEMTRLALRNRYRGPLEALTDSFGIAMEYLAMIATSQIILTLLIGGCIAGLLSEWVWRRWR